jgi:peptidoglycan/xylan/chitin deacetylase (PgdA/CDA1 family)
MPTSITTSRLVKAAHLGNAAARRAIKRSWRAHGLVLGYHRVAAPSQDPLRLCVGPERFEQQLDVLSRVADFVPLSELASRLHRGRRARPAVALTFDDGYADNLHEALPLLEKYGAPATVFISTAWIGRGEPFWWDRFSAILQAFERLPSDVRLQIGDDEFIWQRQAGESEHPRDRKQLLSALRTRLMSATDLERRAALDQLESLANPANMDDSAGRPMTKNELRRLASSPLIDIGAHTMTHCHLPDLPSDAQFEEIRGSREKCQELVGELPSSFAYPYGAFNAATPEVVRSAGFERACSTENELFWAGSDMMLVPRVFPWNHTARQFSAVMRMQRLL